MRLIFQGMKKFEKDFYSKELSKWLIIILIIIIIIYHVSHLNSYWQNNLFLKGFFVYIVFYFDTAMDGTDPSE